MNEKYRWSFFDSQCIVPANLQLETRFSSSNRQLETMQISCKRPWRIVTVLCLTILTYLSGVAGTIL